jgi:hypothetical protein
MPIDPRRTSRITKIVQVRITCDTCHHPLAEQHDTLTVFTDRAGAIATLHDSARDQGWTIGPDGQAACPTCTARATCALRGHDYGTDLDGGWRLCACDRSIPAHADVPRSPLGRGACGMEWRVCRRCDHIDEHHVTDPPPDDEGVQPGGHLRQDVPAGPALPTHTTTRPTTSKHMTSRENAMVSPTDRAAAAGGGAR